MKNVCVCVCELEIVRNLFVVKDFDVAAVVVAVQRTGHRKEQPLVIEAALERASVSDEIFDRVTNRGVVALEVCEPRPLTGTVPVEFTVEGTKAAVDINVRLIRRQQESHGYTTGCYGMFVLVVCRVSVELEQPIYQVTDSVEGDISQGGRLA
jgi:hypothetical protein